MLQLSSDRHFHFEFLRLLATVRGGGGDVAELLNVFEKIVPGDFESWYTEFHKLALDVKTSIESQHDLDRVSLCESWLRASRYFFAAQFYLPRNPPDERVQTMWQNYVECFDKAVGNLDLPAERHVLKGDGFDIPIILFRASTDKRPRPILIMGNGFDGSMEEMLHFHGFQALERGYHVILYEGPGQCTPRRQQQLGFIHDWERVVTPVVDYAESMEDVDPKRIVLMGYSLGGYLAIRAAAFEHRLAAVLCIDGLYDLFLAFGHRVGPEALQHFKNGEPEAFEAAAAQKAKDSTVLRWFLNQAPWAYKTNSMYDAMKLIKKMTMEGVAHQVQCPAFIGDAEYDIFTETEQCKLIAEALGKKATWRIFTQKEAADAHCHIGATVVLNQVVFKWINEQLAGRG